MERKSIDRTSQRRPSGAAVLRPALTTALYRALFEEWAQTGYAAISLEKVAARAGAGKAAIYRRWSSKRDFASEAIETVGSTLTDFPDRGALTSDLTAFLLAMRRALRHRLVRRILPDLLAERACSRELAPVLDRLTARQWREGERLLDRAVARGELRPGLDRELALDIVPSALYWRMIVRERALARRDVERLAQALVAALRAC